MDAVSSSLARRPETDGGLDADDGRAVGVGLGGADRGAELLRGVVAALDDEDLPVVGLVALGNVLGEGKASVAVDGDLVVIVQDDDLAQAEVPSERARLGGDALLQAAVAANYPRAVVLREWCSVCVCVCVERSL